jgi:hypothetical protein
MRWHWDQNENSKATKGTRDGDQVRSATKISKLPNEPETSISVFGILNLRTSEAIGKKAALNHLTP